MKLLGTEGFTSSHNVSHFTPLTVFGNWQNYDFEDNWTNLLTVIFNVIQLNFLALAEVPSNSRTLPLWNPCLSFTTAQSQSLSPQRDAAWLHSRGTEVNLIGCFSNKCGGFQSWNLSHSAALQTSFHTLINDKADLPRGTTRLAIEQNNASMY